MIFLVTKPVEVNVNKLRVLIPNITSWEDWPVNNEECENGVGHPLFDGEDGIEFTVDIDSGKIDNWPVGNTMETWDKVRDEGIYELYNCQELLYKLEYSYVPKVLDTRGDGYGDYMQFKVDENGTILKWNPDHIQRLIDECIEDHGYYR
jgi:hypothetical protein